MLEMLPAVNTSVLRYAWYPVNRLLGFHVLF